MPGPTRAITGRLSTLSRCDRGGVASTTCVAKQPSYVQVCAWARLEAATENAERVVWQCWLQQFVPIVVLVDRARRMYRTSSCSGWVQVYLPLGTSLRWLLCHWWSTVAHDVVSTDDTSKHPLVLCICGSSTPKHNATTVNFEITQNHVTYY